MADAFDQKCAALQKRGWKKQLHNKTKEVRFVKRMGIGPSGQQAFYAAIDEKEIENNDLGGLIALSKLREFRVDAVRLGRCTPEEAEKLGATRGALPA